MKLRANFNWKLALFVVLLFPVLLSFGFWQLDRAEEKRQMQESQQALIDLPNVRYEELTPEQFENYRNVQVIVTFAEEYFLLDNQTFDGDVGYEVVQPAYLRNGEMLMVSRGWIKGDPARRQLPEVPGFDGMLAISGYLYQPNENFMLEEDQMGEGWPKVMQSINVEKLYKAMGKNGKIRPPFLVRLDGASLGVLTPHWAIINIQPEKHTGYAVQWFGMAGLLVTLFLLASIKRVED